ncbi:MAG: translocation/assembly module TamB domain-containing protein [Bryobacteraceae bacterium]|jgi:translocation and assembly module TamB
MTRRRLGWTVAGSIAALTVVLAVSFALVVRSSWFRGQVRRRIVSAVESATGGRVEAGAFTYDWRRRRAVATNFTIHGTEAAGKPPLFRAASVVVGLKIVSVLRRRVDMEYLDVVQPRVYLIVYPGGRTNIPGPQTGGDARRAVRNVLDLAIGRFSVQDGLVEVESRGSAPFDAHGRNFRANVSYDPAGPRYRGELAFQPLDLNFAGYAPTAVDVSLGLAVARDRIAIGPARLRTGDSQIEFSGTVEDLASPRAAFRYQARVSQADVARFLRTKLLESGAVQSSGTAVWTGGANFTVKGRLNAYNLEYRDSSVRLAGFRADGALSASPSGIDVAGLRLSGEYALPGNRIPVDAQIAAALVRGSDIDFHGVALALLGGSFQGDAWLGRLDRYRITGEVAGFEARRVVATYSDVPLPWDGRVSGPIQLEGALHHGEPELQAALTLAVTPEPGGPPVRGEVTAKYDSPSGVLDLGRSNLILPASRAEFSGAIGRELRVRVETRDLNDLLPAFGASAASVPVKLEGGAATFEGTVTGGWNEPLIAGHLSAGRFSYAGSGLDSLTGDVTVFAENARLDNAALTRGSLRAEFQAAVALRQWRTTPTSEIFGSGTLRAGSVGELADLAGWSGAPVSGSLQASVHASGTISSPILQSDVTIAAGAFRSEPFERLTAHVSYSGRTLEVASGQVAAGSKQLQIGASYHYAADSFATGLLRFDVSGNVMPLDQIQTLRKARPGILGTIQASARGAIDIHPGHAGRRGFDITELHGAVSTKSLELDGQRLGDAHLTADSEGSVLRATLDADFADSTVRGEGSWKLEDDYPGAASIAFSKFDLARLRNWFSPSQAASPALYAGSAEGELRIDGPLLRPEALKAEARIPQIELHPAPNAASGGVNTQLTLRNDGPIVVRVANSVATIESARLKGRSTDLTVGGRVLLDRADALDLRVNGQIDLAAVGEMVPDIESSGVLVANATVRGAPGDPQIGGRMEVRNASLSVAGLANELSNCNGVILFTGDRATIQTLKGETGGGSIDFTGFIAFGAQTLFRLYASAQDVRVRYPEGLSSAINASLNLTGSPRRSQLAGTLTILSAAFNPGTDVSSVLTRSAEPVETPAARTGWLGGLNFDIQFQPAPDIRVQSSLTQGVSIEATSLRLRGTVSNPVLAGRINITQGQVEFYGTKYTIEQGSIVFSNAVKIEPVVNIDMQTKARGIDVTLNVSGPLGKLNLTPRSDPPLQFSEIVALLASGETPTSDPAALARQNASPNSWQQMGASALLGQAIASPVTGRLERFFGVSRLRIDPTLPGVEYNPQARITLEQQVTPAITFTYITVINSSNPQVVSMQWDLSKQWTVRLVREENGVFGMDFLVKRQFR